MSAKPHQPSSVAHAASVALGSLPPFAVQTTKVRFGPTVSTTAPLPRLIAQRLHQYTAE